MRAVLYADTEAITQQLNVRGVDVNVVGKVIQDDMQALEGICTRIVPQCKVNHYCSGRAIRGQIMQCSAASIFCTTL
jgi:hypothetical protein